LILLSGRAATLYRFSDKYIYSMLVRFPLLIIKNINRDTEPTFLSMAASTKKTATLLGGGPKIYLV